MAESLCFSSFEIVQPSVRGTGRAQAHHAHCFLCAGTQSLQVDTVGITSVALLLF